VFCEAVGLVDLVFDDVTFFVDSVADFTVVVFGVVDFAVVLDALFGALVLVVRGGISSVFTVIIFSVFGVRGRDLWPDEGHGRLSRHG
jgi:hypothetical protein